MRYLAIVMILFFWGCGPKYKVLTALVLPEDPAQKACIQKCTDERATCRDICEADFAICRKKADAVAKKRYEEAMRTYTAKLEQYTKDLERYPCERRFYYYDGCFGYGCGPYYSWIWEPFPPYIPLAKPKKPNYETIKTETEMRMCRIDCGCEKRYIDCFKACGGKVIVRKKCVANCPTSEK